MKNQWRAKILICFWLSYVAFVSSAWKNVVSVTEYCNLRYAASSDKTEVQRHE